MKMGANYDYLSHVYGKFTTLQVNSSCLQMCGTNENIGTQWHDLSV